MIDKELKGEVEVLLNDIRKDLETLAGIMSFLDDGTTDIDEDIADEEAFQEQNVDAYRKAAAPPVND